MSCYHPIAGFPDYEAGLSETGSFRYKLTGAWNPGLDIVDPNVIKIPCGHCLGCRLDYSRQWADRMILELDHTKKAIFVTLTYDNDHVPISYDDDTAEALGMTLNKRDVQLFMKRLRRRFDRELRFYAAGEYGSTTQRPHYHAIIFGLSLTDFDDLRPKGLNELGQCYYISDKFAEIWQNGFCLLCDVSYKTCAYVSRYVMKKAFQPMVLHDCEAEFSLMSRRPGIGAYYLQDHPDLFEYSKIYVSNGNESVGVSVPKYYLGKLKVDNPELYDKIKSDREAFARDREFLKMQQTDLSYVAQLELEENALIDRTEILTRLRR